MSDIIRILYMEDDPGLARLLQKILQRRGFGVDIAPNGEEGLAMLKQAPYDILLVDYNMPFLGGIDVIHTLAANNALPPTIMVTGEGNEAVAVEALKLGATDYIVKDTDMKYLDLLPSVIDQVLYKQQLIRERQQMLETIRQSEERYRLLFEDNPIPSMVYDLRTLRFLAANNAAAVHYGYTTEEFLALVVSDIYAPDQMQKLKSVLAQIDQGTMQSGVWKHRKKDGSLIDVEITSHILWLGDVRAHFILANDITERRKMEENLLRAQKLESLGVLAGGLAHDFNNLLTAILGNISLALMESPPDSGVSRYLAESEKATSRAQNLTQQLLTFARGGTPLKRPLAMKKIIEDSAGFALHGSKARCRCSIAPDLWLIEADEGQLGQVVHNLIMNADQAMPDGGTIAITAENILLAEGGPSSLKPGEYVRISVTDQGIGIPEEYLEKIFDPYFTTKQKGSGLGLATCYSIMKRHDGLITVDSRLGEGTTFSLYLPALQHAKTVPLKETARVQQGSGRILVMDDEAMITEVAAKILTRLGYEVECSRDGSEAIALYEKALNSARPFDAVIMDLTIPGGMGGKDTIAKLREIDPGVKAIVSSGYSDDPIMAHYREYGFRGVVSKPYTIKVLSEAIHNVLALGKNSSLV